MMLISKLMAGSATKALPESAISTRFSIELTASMGSSICLPSAIR